MNRDFKIIGNKVIVTTDNKGSVTKELTNNIEDILICENNVEEIEKELEKQKEKLDTSKRKRKTSAISDMGLGTLWLFNSILNASLGNWFASGCHLLCSAIWYSKGYFFVIKEETKHIKISQHSISELQEALDIEKEKLNELEKDQTNDLMCISPDRKAINTSEQIMSLRKKLDVIHDYQANKKKIIEFYKKGILKEMLASKLFLNYYEENDYNLLEELIKNDLNIEDNIVDKKVKRLR